MALSDGIFAGMVSVSTILVTEGFRFLFGRKKNVKETEKISAETKALSDSGQRERARFCEEQLNHLEVKYKEQQVENDRLRAILKQMTVELDELQRKTNETLNDITFLRAELAAYKT